MIDEASVDAIDKARVLLDQFKGRSETLAQAIDDFLLDLLRFVVESTRERFPRSGAAIGAYEIDQDQPVVGVVV
ncbi:hypothetical protein [Mesorhizobium sp.]|uniref:hypothetical protein n=2 Tax=Mesorhizobium sp. TaxID=1871066 RepID=UPI002580C7B0|nr:hypothetical protein [Mesorhizobium sp.]